MGIKEANPFKSFLLHKSKTFPTRYLLNGILWHLKIFQSFTERFANEYHFISKSVCREEPDKDEAFKSCWETSFLWRREARSSHRLSLPRFYRVSRVLSLWPFGCLRKFSKALRCAVECVQRDQALFFFYQQLNASASCSFLVLRFTFVRLHRHDSLHAAARNNCSDSSAKFAIVPTKIPMLDKANSVCP